MVIRPGPAIGREAAQRLARDELAKSIYHPHRSFLGWIADKLYRNVNADVPGGWWAVVALIALAVIVAGLVFARVGPVARSRARSAPLREDRPLTAREHRELAERRAADGDYAAAVAECVRAIAAGLEERAILPPGPGRTADELAADAGRLLPAHAGGLAAAARMFDDVRYGGRPGTRAGYERVRDLETALRVRVPA